MKSPGFPANPAPIQPPAPVAVKLRGSCQACTLSKLKCSKDKPTCARCTKRNTKCEYFASKRAGRKQRSRTGNSIPRNPPPKAARQTSLAKVDYSPIIKPPEQFQSELQLGHGYMDGEHHRTLSIYMDGLPSQLTTDSITTPMTLDKTDSDQSLGSPFALSVFDAPDLDFSVGSEQMSFLDSTSFLIPGTTLSATEGAECKLPPPLPDNSSPLDSLSPATSSTSSLQDLRGSYHTSRCGCMARSLAIFQALFPSPFVACRNSSEEDKDHTISQPPIIQGVIAKNEQTIEEVRDILTCSGSNDGYTLIIVTLVVFKVLAWYAAAVQETAPIMPGIHDQDQGSEVVVGKYCIDGEDRQRMAAQMVLSELHRAQSLVNALSHRLKQRGIRSRQRAAYRSTTSLGQNYFSVPFRLFDQLGTDLRARLCGLSAEIVKMLRRG